MKGIKTLAFIFLKSIVFYATGVNFYNVDGTIKSRHAEVDCVQRLKYSNKRKKLI